MAQLTAAERRILKYPPTPKTWKCGRKSKTTTLVDGVPVEVEFTCVGVNSGSAKVCGYCRRPRRASAKLLWPVYLAACKKAGIEPKGATA